MNLFRLFMRRRFLAIFAMLFKFQPNFVLLILLGVVIHSLAIGTRQLNETFL